jgi:hypothetical protein
MLWELENEKRALENIDDKQLKATIVDQNLRPSIPGSTN